MRRSTVVQLVLVNSLLFLAGSGCGPAARDKEKEGTTRTRVGGGVVFIPGGGHGPSGNPGARPGGGNVGRSGFGGSGPAIS